MENAERYLARWRDAGLIGEETARTIQLWEAERGRHGGRQWHVLLAIVLGAILLGAGVLLFVAAHWDAISPVGRMAMTLSMLIFFHGAGLLARARFASLSTAMHAVGTVSAGGAIALVGQIFNMREHWPSAVMLWALCAGAGWLLLRDEFQQTLTLLLTPAWIVSEWEERTRGYSGAGVYLARIGLVIGCVYLAVFLHSRRRAVFGILFGVGAILVPVSVGLLSEGWMSSAYAEPWGSLPLFWRFAAVGIVLVAAVLGTLASRQSAAVAGMAIAVAWALPWAQKTLTEGSGNYTWRYTEPTVLLYAIVAAGALCLVWWGVREEARSLVNYGMVAFAASVMWFYSSSVMDKLGRSLGLIGLGVLFLGGGWMLEQTRRHLMSGMARGEA